ncbi:MAG: transpeptidase family protein [Cytophagaceae bacterium]|nr:transpeptidase family protein [Cytophagaceae bacterium]
MNIKKSIVLRARLAFLAVFLFSLAIVMKLIKVQVVDGEKWRKLAQENIMQYRVVKATRGNIYSDNGSLLATSLPFYKIAMDPSRVEKEKYQKGIDSLSMLLSAYFKDRSAEDYKIRINLARSSNKRYITLNKAMVDFQTKKMMEKWPIFREGRNKGGVIFEKVEKRFRPFSYLAMRTIGFINEDNQGVGLEKSFNEHLAGRDGEALFRRIAGREWMPIHDDSEIRPKQGVDIQTTIDINLQDVAESSLMRHLMEHDADKGCVILMEVATGEIKAMANLGKLPSGEYTEIYNYAVGNEGLTEPGSTFKLASMIALFEDSNMQLTDSVETGRGTYEFYDKIMTDAKPEGYGKITMQEAFEKSSNIGVSRKVYEHFHLNQQKFVDYIISMGLADRIDFQLKGEAIPYIKKTTDRSWSGISLPWMSIGYELKLAPIHTLTFYNGIANNGKVIQPIIVKEIKMADQTIEKFETKVLREKICSDATLSKVKKMLEGVVERGTAKNINNTIYKIAGKTGTAQRIINKKYTQTYYTSFAGYFPADNPKYSCIVVIDNPKGFKLYGSDVAAPVFKEIADKIYARDLDMHKPLLSAVGNQEAFPVIKGGFYEDLQFICNEMSISNHLKAEDEEWVRANPVNRAIMWNKLEMKKDQMPDVTGLKLRDALYILENMGLRVKCGGVGRVESQSIPAGTIISKGMQVNLIVSQ